MKSNYQLKKTNKASVILKNTYPLLPFILLGQEDPLLFLCVNRLIPMQLQTIVGCYKNDPGLTHILLD